MAIDSLILRISFTHPTKYYLNASAIFCDGNHHTTYIETPHHILVLIKNNLVLWTDAHIPKKYSDPYGTLIVLCCIRSHPLSSGANTIKCKGILCAN